MQCCPTKFNQVWLAVCQHQQQVETTVQPAGVVRVSHCFTRQTDSVKLRLAWSALPDIIIEGINTSNSDHNLLSVHAHNFCRLSSLPAHPLSLVSNSPTYAPETEPQLGWCWLCPWMRWSRLARCTCLSGNVWLGWRYLAHSEEQMIKPKLESCRDERKHVTGI